MAYRFLDDYDPQKEQKKRQQNGALSAPRSGNSTNPFSATTKKTVTTAATPRTTTGTALGGSASTPVQLPAVQVPKLTKTTPVQTTKQATHPLKLPEIRAFGAGDYSKAGKAMERGAKTVAAGALGAASSAVEMAGQFTPTSGQQSMGQFSGFGDLGRAVQENRRTGADISANIRQQEAQRREKQLQSQQQIFSAATRLAEKGQQYEAEAKEGLGTVGQFLVDMGVTGTQMAGDALMNLVLPGSGLAMMGLRSYGQAAGEARRAGKTSGQQFLAGLKSAGIEMFTEKMFGAFSKVYGKAGADELVEKLVGKLTKNTTGQALLTWMINAAGEGVEEVTSDLLNPLADRLLGLDNGKGAIYSMEDLAQWGYDFLLGTAMGVLGGGSQLAQGVRQGQAQTAEADYYADLKRSGLGSTGHAANAQKAGNALGRLLPGNDGVAIQRLQMPTLTTYEQRVETTTGEQKVSRMNNENGLAAYTQQERINLSSGIKNKIISTYQETGNFVKNALVNKNNADRAYMGIVPENVANQVKKETGVDISGYGVMMNGVDIRHIIKEHGNPVTEPERGQVAVTAEDIARVPEVIAHPDEVYLSDKTDAKGRKAIVFEKQFGDTYITIQGVSNGKKLLQTNMLYKRKGKARTTRYTMIDAQESAAPVINVQNGPPQSLSYETSVPQEKETVNRLKMPQLVDEQGRTYEQRQEMEQNQSVETKEPVAMTLDEFLGMRGLSAPISDYSLDKVRLPHGETQRQQTKRINDGLQVAQEYSEKRQTAINEYQELVRKGEVRDKTSIEKAIDRANGHEDNESTQAARRMLEKRGIDWRTGLPMGEAEGQKSVNGLKMPQLTTYEQRMAAEQAQQAARETAPEMPVDEDYLDALARDENVFTSDPYTVADRIYDLKLKRAQQQEAPPERPAEQVAQEDLDELTKLFADQANYISSREDRINETENMIADHTTPEKKTMRQNGREAWSYFYRKMVDAGHSVTKFAKATGDQYLYQFYNQARAASSAGVSMITDAQTNINAQKVGKSLNDIFSPIREKGEAYYRAFQMFLFDLHNIDRMSLSKNKEGAVLEAKAALHDFDSNHPEIRTDTEAQLMRLAESMDPDVAALATERMRLLRNLNAAEAIKDKPVFSYEVTADESRERARRALQQNPEFDQYRQEVRTYIDNLMQYRVDSGLMTQENADYLKKLYPNYVPTMRVGTQEAGAGRDRNAVRIGKTVGRAEGGTENLVPLHEALGRQTMKVVREGSKNRFGQRLLDDYIRAGDTAETNRYVQEANEYEHEFSPDTLDDMSREQLTKDKILTVYKDGKLWELTVDDTMFDALKALSPDAEESNMVTRTIRAANNLFKSLVTGYNPTFTVRNTVRDLQTAGLYTRDAAAFARNYPKALAEIKNNGEYWKMYKALGGSFSSVFDYNTGTVKEPKGRTAKLMAKVEALNMAMEQAPRLAEFMGVVEKGGTGTENLADALYAAADVTVNFGRAGALGKVLNANYVPFLNPGIQGFDKLIRRVTETKGGKEWAKLAIRAAALGVAPALLNSLLYHDDEEWDELRDSDKDTNYMFKLGNGVWLKIPKGRELSLLGITADRITDAIKGEKVDILATLNTMGNQVAPANPLTSNIASALFEAQLFDPSDPGRTWYGGDIENQRMQSYAPGQRYDSSTDIFSKAVGGALGISPKKLNYVLDQYTGVVGDFLLPLLTPQAERGMFEKAFTVDVVSSNRLSGDFYDEADQLTYAKNAGDKTAAVVSRFWSKQQSACSDIYQQIREVEASDLSNSEKKQKTRELKAIVNGIQKNAMAVEETYRAAVEKNLFMGMDADEAYRAANKDCFGAEYALQVYSKDVYERAKNARSNGVTYEDYYTYYFGTKGLETTDEKSVTTQKFEFLQNSGMSLTSQAEIYFADMASDKTLETQAQLEISSGITAEQFYQYKVASSGMTKKAEKMQAINSLDLTSAQKDAIYYAEGWAQSTIGQAPWRSGYGGYSGGSGGNPFLRNVSTQAAVSSNPFLRVRQQTTTQAVTSNPFLRGK